MAASAAPSIALRCGKGRAFLQGEDRAASGDRATEVSCWLPGMRRSRAVATRRCAVRCAALAAATSPSQKSAGGIAAATSVCVNPERTRALGHHPRGGKRHGEKYGAACRESVPPEKLDEWMRESVAEIVKNIGEAPFLVHVFSGNEGPAGGLRLEREAADAESWPHMSRRWSTGAATPPDGMILVEELKAEDDDKEVRSSAGDGDCRPGSSPSSSSSKKLWGVLVQGRGTGSAACYILDTCRVGSSFGFCTHFCLARATCFGDAPDVQMKKAWLLGRRQQQQQ